MVDIVSKSNASLVETIELDELKANIDSVYLITNATFVCLMQCGFACLEAGSIRSKNVTNIMMKNILDVFISCWAFWIVGYAVAYGEGSSFMGLTLWGGIAETKDRFAHWFFQFIFAATAATLVSGAAAERCHFVAYLIYSALISGFIYPVAAHWVWSNEGWLYNLGYADFAGSGPVHLLGGVCAGVAAYLLGPRIGRFDGELMPGHSTPLTGIGGMLLITGFIAFNGGSLGTMTSQGAGAEISLVCANTIMAGTGGAALGLTAARMGLIKPKAWNFSITLNASFAGMVSVCAVANEVGPWMSLVLGLTGGLVYFGLHFLVLFFRSIRVCIIYMSSIAMNLFLTVDDPLDATAVHLGGGIWGVLAGPIFKSKGIIFGPNQNNLLVLLYNTIGAIAIFTWAMVTSLIVFGTLKYFKVLRVSREDEIVGMDVAKHNEPAYPAAGWSPAKNSHSIEHEERIGVKITASQLRYKNEAFQDEHV